MSHFPQLFFSSVKLFSTNTGETFLKKIVNEKVTGNNLRGINVLNICPFPPGFIIK